MTYKVGVLGTAHGHVNSYCNRWQELPGLGIEVSGAWDHDAARLEQFCERHGVDSFGSAQDLLGRDDIQGVVIAAETSLHADLVESAASAGKAIVLQKPMALTIPEADRIVASVENSGVPFTMAWQMRVDPQNLKMKELMESGTFGQIFMARRRHGLPVGLNPGFADSWHLDPEKNRDIWADDAAHPIDLVYWLFGEPGSVTAELATLYKPTMPMDNGIAVFRYPEGPMVEVCCSFANPASENTTEIIAEKGSIIQNYGDVPSCNIPRPEDSPGLKWFLRQENQWTYSDLPTPAGHGERIASLAKPIAEFLQGKRPPVATAEEGRTALRMLLACYVSTREGQRVRLNDSRIEKV